VPLGQYENELRGGIATAAAETSNASETETAYPGGTMDENVCCSSAPPEIPSLLQDEGSDAASRISWPKHNIQEQQQPPSAISFPKNRLFMLPEQLFRSLNRHKDSSPRPITTTASLASRGISVSLDSTWTLDVLIPQLLALSAGTTSLMLSTATRILVPMAVAQRAFLWLYTAGQDWYTGYYIRTTLAHMERQYTRQYEVPACLRSIGRLVTHLIILTMLGSIMEWMVGLSHAPCHLVAAGSGGCHWWCGLLWIVAVTGPGHAAGVALSIWGRGLRLQIARNQRPSGRRIVTRPWALVRWIIDPDKWFREVIARDRKDDLEHALKPFDPDWLMFPATWRSLRVIQMIAVAKEMHGSDRIMHTFMRQVLVQQAFSDEWYRVLMCEKRVAWSICLMVGYTFSTLGLFWNMVSKPAQSVSSVSILITAPSVLAVAISGWMNVLVYFDRREQIATKNDSDPVKEALQQYKRVIVPLPRTQSKCL
jgi:hypothetical protein